MSATPASASDAHAESLFSTRWHRVADLRPRLRPHVELRRQTQRGVDWFLLIDGSSSEVRRLNSSSYQLVGRLDGQSTVRQIWEAMLVDAPDLAMTQDEVIQQLVILHERQLVDFDRSPDVEALFQGRERMRTRRRWQLVNPLAFRVSLVDPSRWLRPLVGPVARLFSAQGLFVWCLLMLLALLSAAPYGATIAHDVSRLLASPKAFAAGWLLYPLIKLLHEGAHALAMLRWGAPPRQAGITLLMLTPVPFVDASAAEALRQPLQRAVISAAGIMAELTIAALALGVWLLVEPGALRDLALTAMLIGTVSALLVNGNPLLRFDGYFVFCDLLDLRNLATRSARWWGSLLRRWVLADRQTPRFECLPGERFWLLAYAPLAAAYRLGLILTAALWVGGFSSLLGVLLGALMIGSTIGWPLRDAVKAIFSRSGLAPWLRVGLVLSVLGLFATMPLPHRLLVQGVVWPAEQSLIRARTDGFVGEWLHLDGQAVSAGEAVATLWDDDLAVQHATLMADAAELDVQLFTALSSAPDQVETLRERLAYSRAEAARLEERMADLTVRAQVAGTLVLPKQKDLQSSFLRRGDLVGHVFNDAPLTLRLVLPHSDADLLLEGAREVQVRLASEPDVTHSGRIARDLSAAVSHLPSAALGEPAGGTIPINGEDAQGLTAQEPIVVLEVEVNGLSDKHVGERAYVRIEAGRRSLAERAVRQVRRMLLRHFNPSV